MERTRTAWLCLSIRHWDWTESELDWNGRIKEWKG